MGSTEPAERVVQKCIFFVLVLVSCMKVIKINTDILQSA